MQCFHPIPAWRLPDGSVVLEEGLSGPSVEPGFHVPCGKCVGCRLERAREWGVRCEHEIKVSGPSSCVTLTYAPEYLPADGNLNHRHFQLFMKKLRKSGLFFRPRYFMCGEYGEIDSRPHFHSLLFGVWFDDRQYWRTVNGNKYFRSKTLEKFWTMGHCEIGPADFKAAAYIARYGMKQVNNEWSITPYGRVDLKTGEVKPTVPAYCRMSLKPGIGAGFFFKYRQEIVDFDHVIQDGRPSSLPRYYDKLIEKDDPELLRQLKIDRVDKAMRFDNSQDRRDAAEQIAKARLFSRS